MCKNSIIYRTGLIDEDTGAECVTERVVDVSDACRQRKWLDRKCLFIYTRAKRGKIVVIVRPYPRSDCDGEHIHFFVREIGLKDMKPFIARSFNQCAKDLRLTPDQLRALIRQHEPAR